MDNLTMADVKRKNKESGQFWFRPRTMRFFKSKIESRLIRERYFVTSERFDDDVPRLYTIREYDNVTHKIKTLGAFQQFKTKQDAIDAIKEGII